MKEVDAEMQKKEVEEQMKKTAKQRVFEKVEAYKKRDQELMPKFPAANMIGKLDKYQEVSKELGYGKGSKEEFQAKEQMKRLDLQECEIVANLYT